MKPVTQDDTVGQRGKESYDPLVGGPSTANADNHDAFWGKYGTLSTLCWDAERLDPAGALELARLGGGRLARRLYHSARPSDGRRLCRGGGAAPLLRRPGRRAPDRLECPSPLTNGLAAAAAAAWTAAALSDVADPIRRGQLATPPASASEVTQREHVKVALTPINDPLPGTRFGVKVKWDYQRITDAATYAHGVSEVQQNEHAVVLKHLWSDLDTYSGGQQVTLFAEVVTPREFVADFHLVAQVLPPDEGSKRSVVLAPIAGTWPQFHCVSFECDAAGIGFSADYVRGAVVFHAPPPRFNRVFDSYPPGGDGKGELLLYDGHAISLPEVAEVRIEVVPITGPLTLRAFAGVTEVAHTPRCGADDERSRLAHHDGQRD